MFLTVFFFLFFLSVFKWSSSQNSQIVHLLRDPFNLFSVLWLKKLYISFVIFWGRLNKIHPHSCFPKQLYDLTWILKKKKKKKTLSMVYLSMEPFSLFLLCKHANNRYWTILKKDKWIPMFSYHLCFHISFLYSSVSWSSKWINDNLRVRWQWILGAFSLHHGV